MQVYFELMYKLAVHVVSKLIYAMWTQKSSSSTFVSLSLILAVSFYLDFAVV